MSDFERQPPAPPDPQGGGWTDVSFSETNEGLPYAFRPGMIIATRLEESLEVAREFFPGAEVDGVIGPFARLVNVDDPILLVDELRFRGITAQPNHVYFSHGGVEGNPVEGNPVYGNPVYGNPVYGNPVYGNPVYGNPVYGNPVYGNPVYGNPVYGNSVKLRRRIKPDRSTALPPPRHTDTGDIGERISTPGVPGSPTVIVLDTGLAALPYRPANLGSGITAASASDVDHPDENGDGYLDPVAGHGTFIAGVIAQIAPGCTITLHRVLSTIGDGDEWTIANVIDGLALGDPDRTIVSMSFGGYVLDHPYLMKWTIRALQRRGVQVVASAGNDGSPLPTFPAALPDVIAVGALGASGPAPFTNWGNWVNACAPGVDLVSTFFRWNGPAPIGPYGDDPDDFDGWATWSGTSFAGPVVVGNLARMMMTDAVLAEEAVERLIEGRSLLSLPYLGTVVDAM